MIVQNSKSKGNGRTRSLFKKRKTSPQKKKATSVPKMIVKSPMRSTASSLFRSTHIAIGDALLRKYSGTQNRYYLSLINKAAEKEESNIHNVQLAYLRGFLAQGEHLKRYYKSSTQYHMIRQSLAKYEMHKEMPRIFIQQVSEIIKKCHHNRRLLDYVRLAKLLGLSIDNQQLLTFMRSFQMSVTKRSYSKVLGEISSYNFSANEEESEENPEMMMINSIQRLIQPFKFYDRDHLQLQPIEECFLKKGVNIHSKIPAYQQNQGTRRQYF